MSYSYDRRMSSDDDDDDKEDAEAKALEQLEDLMAICGDAVEAAASLEDELSKRTDSDALRGPLKIAEDIHADLRTAEGSVEKLSDFVACIKSAKDDLPKLEAALKAAKREAKSDDDNSDEVALEAIEEAKDYIKVIKKELRTIESEMADAQETAKD